MLWFGCDEERVEVEDDLICYAGRKIGVRYVFVLFHVMRYKQNSCETNCFSGGVGGGGRRRWKTRHIKLSHDFISKVLTICTHE